MTQLPGATSSVSKKQELLKAGKKKLEEFRRKQAEKAKIATSASQPGASISALEKQPSEADQAPLTGAIVVGTSAEDHLEPLGGVANNAKETDIDTSGNPDSNHSHSEDSNFGTSSLLEHSASLGSDGFRSAHDKFQHKKDDDVSSFQVSSGNGNDYLAPQVSSVRETDNAFSHSGYPVLFNHAPNSTGDPEMDLSLGNSVTSAVLGTSNLPKNSASPLHQDRLSNIGREDNSLAYSPYQESVLSMSSVTDSVFGGKQKSSVFSDMEENKHYGSMAHIGSMGPSSQWTSDHRHADNNYQTLSNQAPPSPPAAGKRSRPSFLDSIQISKGPSPPPLFGEEKAISSSSKIYPMDGLGASVTKKSAKSSFPSGDGADLFSHARENKHDFFSQKQNEDFAALEQHIEELTQEKFSLQRALEASRALAENLASENSALTDSFNQQGSVVNQLKIDLETLQEEIKAHLTELEAVRIEYANVQLECNAADQRAKLLASELIEMEEKSLRVRSNELKLERQLESSQGEIFSCRKKLASLEKDRQDLQSTVDALKEEKKLLQSKLRKASAGWKSIDTNRNVNKDVSTSTEDLARETTAESSNSENFGSSSHGRDASSIQLPHDNVLPSLDGLPFIIPSDQLRMIQNINTLIAELSVEKDQLMQGLSAKSSQCSKLSELNKELTRKLEAQTQRLELLTAQTMANDNIQLRQSEPSTLQENMTYADEGDEVVERVLGWIMKLFPGGPSRRGVSKRL